MANLNEQSFFSIWMDAAFSRKFNFNVSNPIAGVDMYFENKYNKELAFFMGYEKDKVVQRFLYGI